MGTSQEQKAASREAIVTAAAQLFRERGVDRVSVAEVMDAAGLTHGGFPRHFGSKQALVAEALASALETSGNGQLIPVDGVSAFASGYLTQTHRNSPGTGCAYAALGSEVARGDAASRRVLTEAIQRQVEEFSRPATGKALHELDAEAMGNWAAMIGAIVLARISDSDELSDEILAATRKFIGA